MNNHVTDRSCQFTLTSFFLPLQCTLIEWKGDSKLDRQRGCLDFLFERFKTFYMHHIFAEFNWTMSVYRPSLELPEVRKFRPGEI